MNQFDLVQILVKFDKILNKKSNKLSKNIIKKRHFEFFYWKKDKLWFSRKVQRTEFKKVNRPGLISLFFHQISVVNLYFMVTKMLFLRALHQNPPTQNSRKRSSSPVALIFFLFHIFWISREKLKKIERIKTIKKN